MTPFPNRPAPYRHTHFLEEVRRTALSTSDRIAKHAGVWRGHIGETLKRAAAASAPYWTWRILGMVAVSVLAIALGKLVLAIDLSVLPAQTYQQYAGFRDIFMVPIDWALQPFALAAPPWLKNGVVGYLLIAASHWLASPERLARTGIGPRWLVAPSLLWPVTQIGIVTYHRISRQQRASLKQLRTERASEIAGVLKPRTLTEAIDYSEGVLNEHDHERQVFRQSVLANFVSISILATTFFIWSHLATAMLGGLVESGPGIDLRWLLEGLRQQYVRFRDHLTPPAPSWLNDFIITYFVLVVAYWLAMPERFGVSFPAPSILWPLTQVIFAVDNYNSKLRQAELQQERAQIAHKFHAYQRRTRAGTPANLLGYWPDLDSWATLTNQYYERQQDKRLFLLLVLLNLAAISLGIVAFLAWSQLQNDNTAPVSLQALINAGRLRDTYTMAVQLPAIADVSSGFKSSNLLIFRDSPAKEEVAKHIVLIGLLAYGLPILACLVSNILTATRDVFYGERALSLQGLVWILVFCVPAFIAFVPTASYLDARHDAFIQNSVGGKEQSVEPQEEPRSEGAKLVLSFDGDHGQISISLVELALAFALSAAVSGLTIYTTLLAFRSVREVGAR